MKFTKIIKKKKTITLINLNFKLKNKISFNSFVKIKIKKFTAFQFNSNQIKFIPIEVFNLKHLNLSIRI